MPRLVEYLTLVSIVLATFSLRILPYIASGVPYHTDTWPQIANADFLLAKTPTGLSPSNGFNDNIFWPGLTLFTGMLSPLLYVPPIRLIPVAVPLIASLAFLLFTVFLRRLGLDFGTSALSSLLFGLALGSAVITAGGTKEAFALPLMFLELTLLALGIQTSRKRYFSLALLSFVTLLLAHHLTSVVSLFVSVYLLLYYSVAVRKGVGGSIAKGIVLIIFFTILSTYYFFVYAAPVQLIVLSPSVIISATAYEVAFLLPLALGLSILRTRRVVKGWTIMVLLFVASVVLISPGVRLTADAPLIPLSLLTLASPYVLMLLLSVYSVLTSRDGNWNGTFGLAAFWGLGLVGILTFEAFGTSGVGGVSLRIADFVYPAAIVLASVGIVGWTRRSLSRAASYLSVLFIVSASLGGFAWVALYSGPLGGSQRVYSASDVSAVSRVSISLPANTTLYTDARYVFVLSLHPEVKTDITNGYKYLTTSRFGNPGCMLLSSLLTKIGYIAYDYGFATDPSSVNSLANQSSIYYPYSNGESVLLCSNF